MPRTKPAEERRTDLLDAAEAVIVERGLGATTIEDVTKRANVAKGTFYLYFDSKDAVVAALQQRFGEGVAKRVADAIGTRRSWLAKLDAVVTACFEDYDRQYAVHDILFHQSSVGRSAAEGGTRSHAPVVAVIRRLLSDGVERGVYRIDDVEPTAVILYHAIHGAFEAGSHGEGSAPRQRLISATQQLLRRAAGA
jgi:AcrR family transcriptional regulator